MRAETGRQNVALFNLRGECVCAVTQNFHCLVYICKWHENTTSIDLGIKNKFYIVGEFANTESELWRLTCIWGTHLNLKFLVSFKLGLLNSYGIYNTLLSIIQYNKRVKNSSLSFVIRVNTPVFVCLFVPESLAFSGPPKMQCNLWLWNSFSPHVFLSLKYGNRLLLMFGKFENWQIFKTWLNISKYFYAKMSH